MSLDESEANSESEQAIRSEIESLYQTLFEPLRYGIFPVEDQLRLQLQETTTVLLRKREILEELKEADPLLIQASGALDRVRNYEANGEKYASHGVVSSMILADTALHAAWSHLTDASFMNGVERLPELNFSSPIPHEQIKHIAADFLPAVKSLIASTAEYMKTMITDISRNAAVAAELEGRLQRERRRLILECAEDVDDTARRRGEPPQYDHVALETHSPPPSYEPG
ncbi:hypothetical protein DFJ77DRAFT_182341 [Powellomyces hirtus]|nr:hypothetical protein DFJ77DRAFT_182341 [Powellomyces hirtus]